MTLSLFDALEDDLCCYGTPKPGEVRLCSLPATHRACWLIPDTYADGSPSTRAGSGGISCCREHASYYASAWCPIYPMQRDSAWIEILDA